MWVEWIKYTPEARRGSQGASRAAPGKSGLHARGKGERVLALESREGFKLVLEKAEELEIKLPTSAGSSKLGLPRQTVV